MPPPLVRFTTRRLMAAVAVAALAVGGAALWRRAGDYRRRSDHFASLGVSLAKRAGRTPPGVSLAGDGFRRGSGGVVPPIDHAMASRLVEHFAALARKYDRAARYPFLPVAPDPPEPDGE